MERPETGFEQLSAQYGEDVARYMRVIIETAENRPISPKAAPVPQAAEITFETLSSRYGEPAAEAILREIEKVTYPRAMRKLSAVKSLLPSEIQTLNRLIRYVAANDNVSPVHLEQDLVQNFDVIVLSQLESRRFPDAVEHLLDLSECKG